MGSQIFDYWYGSCPSLGDVWFFFDGCLGLIRRDLLSSITSMETYLTRLSQQITHWLHPTVCIFGVSIFFAVNDELELTRIDRPRLAGRISGVICPNSNEFGQIRIVDFHIATKLFRIPTGETQIAGVNPGYWSGESLFSWFEITIKYNYVPS